MALYPKNPGNDKKEKSLFWAAKIIGVICIVGGIYSLYVYIPAVTWNAPAVVSKTAYWSWVILSIAKSICLITIGIGLLVYYKKSLSALTCYWIFIPLMVYLIIIFLRDFIYYKPTILRIISEVAYVSAFLAAIFYWFYHRKKYPEEFGLKDGNL